MPELVIVEGDQVNGTCTHQVAGTDSSTSAACSGSAPYPYAGNMDSKLSDFVTIDGTAVALIDSESNLPSPHVASSSADPELPNCVLASFVSLTNNGLGKPHSSAGSTFVTVDGTAVLLNNDAMDTCGNEPNGGGSTVTASVQAFVSCSE